MMISTRGRYALRMMLDLAEHQGNDYIALKDIATEQSAPAQKTADPHAVEKLKAALEELKPAVDSCSSTQCKRILESVENIAFDNQVNDLLSKLVNQIDDYEFSEAEDTIKDIEKAIS